MRAGGSQSKRAPSPKNCGLSSHAVVMSENDSVITAMVSPRRRNTGRPMRVATAAPTIPAPSKPNPRSHPQRAVIEPPTAAPIATNAIWPEADLAAPAGEHHQRQRDHRVDHRDGCEVDAALAQEQRQRDEHQRDQQHEPDSGGADLRQARELPRHRPRLAYRAPRRRFDATAQPAARGRHEERDEHDDEQHRLDVLALAPAPHHRLLDDAQSDGRDHDGRESLHAADHRGRQRAQQDRGAEHGADREPDDAGAQEHRQERQHRGDDPDERLEPANRDTEERGAVGVLGGAPHGDADASAEEEREERAHDRHGDRGDHLVATEPHHAHRERRVDR